MNQGEGLRRSPKMAVEGRNVVPRRNWGMISLWCRMGPAMRCGKNVTKKRIALVSVCGSAFALLQVDQVAQRWVNVKNEMPSGRTTLPHSMMTDSDARKKVKAAGNRIFEVTQS